jgi:hypothetical protein
LLFGVGQTIAVPVGATVGAVEWVRPFARDRRGGAQGKEERNQDAHELLAVVLRFLHVCTLLVFLLCVYTGNPLFPLSERTAVIVTGVGREVSDARAPARDAAWSIRSSANT